MKVSSLVWALLLVSTPVLMSYLLLTLLTGVAPAPAVRATLPLRSGWSTAADPRPARPPRSTAPAPGPHRSAS
jgi:hypothetical protein